MTVVTESQAQGDFESEPDTFQKAHQEIAQLSLEALDGERPNLIDKVVQHQSLLNRSFVGRSEVIELAMLCAMLGEPLLLLGPPGTGKSQLCAQLSESLHIPKAQCFEYLMTPFTEPSELFGPIDLEALKLGRFIRQRQGSLAHARVAFLDEIFRANSAILNALLALLNDRVYFEEGQAKPSKLEFLFAASNDLPSDPSLFALSDRFTLKVPVENTHGHAWHDLLERGLEGEQYKQNAVSPWRNGPCHFLDLLKLRRFLQLSLARELTDQSLKEYCFPNEIMIEFQRIVTALELDLGIYISDRKLIKLYKLIRGLCLIRGRSTVRLEDLQVLRFIAQAPGERQLIHDYVTRALQALI